MDIHRCRFVDYPPSAINALAFSHTSGSAGNSQPLRLAIGRADGDIEIWDPQKGAWIHEITLRGGKDRTVDGLTWIHDPDEKDQDGYITRGKLRLFSIGYSSSVTEWDLLTGLPLRQSSGSHSEVWCLAAQPKWAAKKASQQSGATTASVDDNHGQDLVVGCADGSLVQLSTADDDLLFKKYISRASKKNARALSIAFQSRDVIVAGFGDSSIRVYDIRNGTLLRTMALGSGPRTGPKETLVWAVECLKNGTIVSGDSKGDVSFWDGKNYTQLQKIKGHEADILCLASSEDGNTVFSAGMDRRTTVYQLGGAEGQRRRWAKTSHRRYHHHDIKAMARFENSSMSLVVSGGLDTAPVIIPVREYGKEHHRTLPYTPQLPPVTSAGRMLVSWWNNEVKIWRIKTRQPELGIVMPSEETNYKILAELALKGDENITSLSLSASGKIMAIATAAEVKIFHLRQPTVERGEQLKIVKMDTPQALQRVGARLVQMSPDSKWLFYITLDNRPQIVRLVSDAADSDEVSIHPNVVPLHRISRPASSQNCLNGRWGSYERTITRAAFSSDSRVLAISDLAGYIDTFVLSGHEDPTAPAVDVASGRDSGSPSPPNGSNIDTDSEDDEDSPRTVVIFHGQHWTINPSAALLPRLPSTPLILSFRPATHAPQPTTNGNPAVHPTRHNPHAHAHSLPSSAETEDRLFVLTASHAIYEFETLRGRLTDWARRNPAEALPKTFRLQRDRAIGCIWDVHGSDAATAAATTTTSTPPPRARIWLYASSWICMFDLAASTTSTASAPTSSNTPTQQTLPPSTPIPLTTQTSLATTTTPTSTPRPSTKRKPQPIDAHLASKRRTTGAGSRVPDAELAGGMRSRAVRVISAAGDGAADAAWLPLHSRPGASTELDDDDDADAMDLDDDNDDADAPGGSALRRLRRGGAESDDDEDEDDDEADDDDEGHHQTRRGSTPFFLTNRYRPILGIAALAREGDAGEGGAVEVAVVERPAWELALPPRFRGARD